MNISARGQGVGLARSAYTLPYSSENRTCSAPDIPPLHDVAPVSQFRPKHLLDLKPDENTSLPLQPFQYRVIPLFSPKFAMDYHPPSISEWAPPPDGKNWNRGGGGGVKAMPFLS